MGVCGGRGECQACLAGNRLTSFAFVWRITRTCRTLSMGSTFTPEQAKHRIMEWCVRGLSIPDVPGGKRRHMEDRPRDYPEHELRSVEDLVARANE